MYGHRGAHSGVPRSTGAAGFHAAVRMILATLTLAASIAATPTAQDAANIALGTAIAQRVGDALWPGWSKIPFRIDLITANGPVLLNVDRPFTPPKFPTDLEATLFLNGAPTIVIGEPRFTQSSTPIRWSITLLHEHFHQWQYSWPEYPSAVNALGLSGNANDASWMLNYPFPYADSRIDTAYAQMASRLADALDAVNAPNFLDAVASYRQTRAAFKKMLAPNDYKYFAFQCWQEGVARYTEIAVARLAVGAHLQDPAFLSYAQATAIMRDGDDMYAAVRKRLRTIPLQRDKRIDFYALGAGEALLLDRVRPDWRQRYLNPRLDLDALWCGVGEVGCVKGSV
jgi:hypothetical protein